MCRQLLSLVPAGKWETARVEKLSNLPRYHVLACESDPSKAEALVKQGFHITPVDAAIPAVDFIVLAIPDALIGSLARQFVPKMKPGSTLVMLDAAAAYINDLPEPRGVTFMLTHPCHPPFFTEQATLEARHDYFGGTAVQDIVVSLVHGS